VVAVTAKAVPSETGQRLRQGLVATLLRQIERGHAEAARLRDAEPWLWWTALAVVACGLLLLGLFGEPAAVTRSGWGVILPLLPLAACLTAWMWRASRTF